MPTPFTSSIFFHLISSLVLNAKEIHWAIGWLEYFSNEYKMVFHSFSFNPLVSNLANLNEPVVSVPVLSNTICLMFLKFSRLVAFRNKIPVLAARPNPTAIAAGVANPMAHGQAITNTAILLMSACVNNADCPG